MSKDRGNYDTTQFIIKDTKAHSRELAKVKESYEENYVKNVVNKKLDETNFARYYNKVNELVTGIDVHDKHYVELSRGNSYYTKTTIKEDFKSVHYLSNMLN